MAISDYLSSGIMQPTQAGMFAPQQSMYNQASLRPGTEIVQNSLEAMLDPTSSYIQNARRRGLETAATRGGINSSIAAGAAERSALEAAAPLAAQAVNIEQSREQVQAQNWIDQQGFNREFQGQLTMLPVNNAANMLAAISQYALEDPELFTPEVVSGYSNFFQRNFQDVFKRFFG